jgi:hypothetical protein
MTYVGAGKPSLAADAYRRALKCSPDFLPALEGVAQIEYQRDAPDGEASLQRVLTVRPADPTTHAMLAALDEIPALTKKLVALRTAEDKRHSQTTRYQLVEVSPGPRTPKTSPN